MSVAAILHQRTNEILPEANGIAGALDGALSTVSGWLGQGFKLLQGTFLGNILSGIQDAIARFQELMASIREIVEKIQEFIRGAAMPWHLPDYANKWREIADNAGEASAVIGPIGLRAPNTQWTGEAANAYQTASSEQVVAFDLLQAAANDQAGILDDAASKGKAIYQSLAALIISIVIHLIATKASVATIVGIPIAVIITINKWYGFRGKILSLIKQTIALVQQQRDASATIKGRIQEAQNQFPGGQWAPIVGA